jgi:hypothetical protein
MTDPTATTTTPANAAPSAGAPSAAVPPAAPPVAPAAGTPAVSPPAPAASTVPAGGSPVAAPAAAPATPAGAMSPPQALIDQLPPHLKELWVEHNRSLAAVRKALEASEGKNQQNEERIATFEREKATRQGNFEELAKQEKARADKLAAEVRLRNAKIAARYEARAQGLIDESLVDGIVLDGTEVDENGNINAAILQSRIDAHKAAHPRFYEKPGVSTPAAGGAPATTPATPGSTGPGVTPPPPGTPSTGKNWNDPKVTRQDVENEVKRIQRDAAQQAYRPPSAGVGV